MQQYPDYKYRPRKKAKGLQNSTNDLTVQQQLNNTSNSVGEQQSQQSSTGSANPASSTTTNNSNLELMDCTGGVNNHHVINNNVINSTKLSINCGMTGKMSSSVKNSRISISNQSANSLHLLNPASKLKFKLTIDRKLKDSIKKNPLPISVGHLTPSTTTPIKIPSSPNSTGSTVDLPESPDSSSLSSFYDDATLTSTSTNASSITLNSSLKTKLTTSLTLNNSTGKSQLGSQFNSLNLLLNGSTTGQTSSIVNHNSAAALLGLNVGLSGSLRDNDNLCNDDLSEFIGDELSLSSELNQCSSSNSPIEFNLNLLNSNPHHNHLSNLDHSSLIMKCSDDDQFNDLLHCEQDKENGEQSTSQQTNSNHKHINQPQAADPQTNDQSINQFLSAAAHSDQLMGQVDSTSNQANANSTATKLTSTNSISTLIYTPEHSLASNCSSVGSNHISSLVSGTGNLATGLHTSFTHSLNELEDLQDVLQLENPWATELNSYNLTPISDLDSLDTASSSSGSHFEFPDYASPEVSDILGEDWVSDLGLDKNNIVLK